MVGGLHTHDPVDGPLQPPVCGRGVDPGHVITQWDVQNHDDSDDRGELQPGARSPLRRTVDGSDSFGR